VSSITCPSCGTVTYLGAVRRHAEEFCRTCDYPLFWARDAARLAGGDAVSEGAGLRRLPGTAGRVTMASVSCWSCDEPNLALARVCVRCGVDLSGPPPERPAPIPTVTFPVFEPEPEPEPDLEPPARSDLAYWLTLAGIAALLVIFALLAS
jgi:hypothetical protein